MSFLRKSPVQPSPEQMAELPLNDIVGAGGAIAIEGFQGGTDAIPFDDLIEQLSPEAHRANDAFTAASDIVESTSFDDSLKEVKEDKLFEDKMITNGLKKRRRRMSK